MNKILIISSTFYPHPTVGSVRMTQWCRYLPEFGWKPTVLCRHYGYTATREGLDADVHPEVDVDYLTRQVKPEEAGIAPATFKGRFKQWVVKSPIKWAAVPDVSIGGWKKARLRALDVVREVQPTVLLSSSPAHSVHDLGMWLAEQTGVPWVADFRDPYLIDPRYAPRGWGRLFFGRHRAFEEQVYRQAALITHAIPLQARWARRVYPWARERIVTIPNGVPEELIELVEARRTAGGFTKEGPKRICVVGAGAGTAEIRALADAVGHIGGASGAVELRIVGAKPPNASELATLPWVTMRGWVSHQEALHEIAMADILVALLSKKRSSSLVLSSKLFEYLAAGRPIVIINPTRSDEYFLSRYKGVWIERESKSGAVSIEQLAESLYKAIEVNNSVLTKQARRIGIEFNRKSQVQSIVDLINLQ